MLGKYDKESCKHMKELFCMVTEGLKKTQVYSCQE